MRRRQARVNHSAFLGRPASPAPSRGQTDRADPPRPRREPVVGSRSPRGCTHAGGRNALTTLAPPLARSEPAKHRDAEHRLVVPPRTSIHAWVSGLPEHWPGGPRPAHVHHPRSGAAEETGQLADRCDPATPPSPSSIPQLTTPQQSPEPTGMLPIRMAPGAGSQYTGTESLYIVLMTCLSGLLPPLSPAPHLR